MKKTEEKCALILENIQDGYYEVDLDGNYTFFNEGLLRITGYTREEMLGMNKRAIVDEYNNRKVFKVFHQVYLTGIPAHAFDWECIRKDGTRRFVEVSVSLKKDIYGNPVGFMGISRDITERKKYLAELEAKENELKQKNKSLEDANTALNIIMKKVEENRLELEETLRNNLQKGVMPYLRNAKEKTRDKAAVEYLNLLEESLNSIFAPFAHDLAPKFPSLTSAETEELDILVADFTRGLHLQRIPVKTVSDRSAESSGDFSYSSWRRRIVTFGNLSGSQRSELQSFIHSYAR